MTPDDLESYQSGSSETGLDERLIVVLDENSLNQVRLLQDVNNFESKTCGRQQVEPYECFPAESIDGYKQFSNEQWASIMGMDWDTFDYLRDIGRNN